MSTGRRSRQTLEDWVNAFREVIADRYDRAVGQKLIDEYYEFSDFFNYGYWDDGVTSTREACENLMEKLLADIPEKKGRILDVACGKGATTRYLTNYFRAEDITAINISKEQLKVCRENAPDCTFIEMDATELEFPDGHFDTIICVEAAQHFDTREKFLREACRVLAPQGRLVMSDVLTARPLRARAGQPEENMIQNLDEYRQVFERAGFHEPMIFDASQKCTAGLAAAVERFARRKFEAGEFGKAIYWMAKKKAQQLNQSPSTYALVSCVKN
jgi:ubiquinone/menaquinone biosynthesis C-methylase UbiE